MIKRYIDANDFWNRRPENLDPKMSEFNRGWTKYAKEILEALEATPTADVVEVRHGAWMSAYEYALKIGCTDERRLEEAKADKRWKFCPFCEQQVKWDFNYCPNCGAKMDGEIEREIDASGERDETPIGRVLDGILDKIRGEISRVQAVSNDRYPILTVFVTGLLYRFLEGMRRNCYFMLKDEKDIPRGKIFGCKMRTYEGDGLAFYVADTPEVQI